MRSGYTLKRCYQDLLHDHELWYMVPVVSRDAIQLFGIKTVWLEVEIDHGQ